MVKNEGKKEHVTFVLFGGTGDLTRRKLVPAFARLVHDGLLSKGSSVIGVARREFNDKDYKKWLVSDLKDKEDREHVRSLNIRYLKGDFSIKNGLKGLKSLVSVCEPGYKCSRVYYLATSFKFFPGIVRELKKYGLDDKSGGFARIVFEKPFGSDLKSSERLDAGIKRVFKEKDVFRIDHYLAKESVQNILSLKKNKVFESLLSAKNIDSIEIDAFESLGVGNRLGYYNDAGAIRDMIQSHLLQVMALILINSPKSDKLIHEQKVKVLKKINILGIKEHMLGQYRSYEKEIRKAGLKNINTETFARIVLNCNNKRWSGTKIVLRTGKKMRKKFGQIRLNFEKEMERGTRVEINIFPKQNVNIIKKNYMGVSQLINNLEFVFCPKCNFGPNSTDEYSVLLNKVVQGDKSLFTSEGEVRESWKIVDKIEKLKKKIKFIKYDDGDLIK